MNKVENENIRNLSSETWREIKQIKEKYGYEEINNDFYLGNLRDSTYFIDKFFCHDQGTLLNEVSIEKSSIVTGFGPTNTPTAGTLSVMLKAINLQKETGIYTDIIISELGAWNSRNSKMKDLVMNARKFVMFINLIGFDNKNGDVRTHINCNNFLLSGILGKILSEKDFKENKEATDSLYDALNLRTNGLGIMIDGTYTVSDILNPLITKNKDRVLVLAGIEEHYFTLLARKALERIKAKYPEILENNENKKVGAMYTKLVRGLFPYPKMSKSIPDSAVNINDNHEDLKNKIIHCDCKNEEVILQMMHLVSNWSKEKLDDVNNAYVENDNNWIQFKKEYYEYFVDLSEKWKLVETEVNKKNFFISDLFV